MHIDLQLSPHRMIWLLIPLTAAALDWTENYIGNDEYLGPALAAVDQG
jgi:hypothetical protein